MSMQELNRLRVIEKLVDKRIGAKEAATMLGISTRQIRRLKARYISHGALGIKSRKRSRCGREPISMHLKEQAITIIQDLYSDYGPTLACEKLFEYHKISLSRELVRQMMINSAIWQPKRTKAIKVHQPRHRRQYYGELIQIDGSEHDWFEGRNSKCTLLVMIDDATSQIVAMRFVRAETTLDYFAILKDYLEQYGKPMCFYSDRHGVFHINLPSKQSGNGLTQFGRALKELQINSIFANSPQAKGRVERANRTLQDRLVKELRRLEISDIDTANRFLDAFIEEYNIKFAKPPPEPIDKHRPLSEQELQSLDFICSIQVKRKISKNLTVRHQNVIYNIKEPGKERHLIRAGVVLSQNVNNKITILYNNKPLNYEVYSENMYHGQVVSRKELDSILNQRLKWWRPSNHQSITQSHNQL